MATEGDSDVTAGASAGVEPEVVRLGVAQGEFVVVAGAASDAGARAAREAVFSVGQTLRLLVSTFGLGSSEPGEAFPQA